VVYGIVQEHGGNITLESLTGEGTTFKIEFMKTINQR
jgi:signal transduction histidine kinase